MSYKVCFESCSEYQSVLCSVFLLFCNSPARVLVWFEFTQMNCIVFPREKCQTRTFQKLHLSHVYLGLGAKWWISPNGLGLMRFFLMPFFFSFFSQYVCLLHPQWPFVPMCRSHIPPWGNVLSSCCCLIHVFCRWSLLGQFYSNHSLQESRTWIGSVVCGGAF